MFDKRIGALKLVSASEIRERYGWSRGKLCQKVTKGSFPSPIDKNSSKENLWNARAVEAFDQARLRRLM